MKPVSIAWLLVCVLAPQFAHPQQEKTQISKLKYLPSRKLSDVDVSLTRTFSQSPGSAPSAAESEAPQVSAPVLKTRTENAKEARYASKRSRLMSSPVTNGNLPAYALRHDLNNLEAQEGSIQVAKGARRSSPVEIVRGDILSARIAQDLIGYVEAQSPIRAVISEGPYKGAWLIGNATMDKKTKNILIRFSTFRSQDIETHLEGSVHSVSGELGLRGEFVSNYWNYFWAEVLASGVSGYANALTERKRNFFGYSDIVPTPDAATHQALASAAQKTSERMAKRARETPEFTIVRGPTNVQVFITKGPSDL